MSTEPGQLHAQGLRVRVSDTAPGAPLVRHVDHDAESGRGMLLIDSLAEQWGVEPSQSGKAMWFQVTAPHDS